MATPGASEKWSSRAAFISSAIGSAVGLGNIWRFPSLAFTYNGFWIPYILALFFVGIPLLLLELALGQTFQAGDVIVFGKMHPRLRSIGVASVYCGFMVVVYYCALLGWSVRCLGFAFKSPLPWHDSINSSSGAWGFVVKDVIGMDDEFLADDNALTPTEIVWQNLLCLVLTWTVIFLALLGGPKWTGRITYATMGLPVVVLVALLFKLGDMNGVSDGVEEYIGKWNLKYLVDEPGQWPMAVSQIFFSLSVTFGIMTAYGAYNKPNQNVVQDSVIIGLANSMFSFVAGFAVFGTLGHLANHQGVSIDKLRVSGPGLMFGTYPVALSSTSGGDHWNRLLFITIFLLGIDSAFSLAEAVVKVLQDTKYFSTVARWKLTLGVCVFAAVCGLPYTTDAALVLLDVVDYYINFVMLFVGFLECFAAGWLYKIDEQFKKVGVLPVVTLLGTYFSASILGSTIAFGYGGTTGWALGVPVGIILAASGFAVSIQMLGDKGRLLMWDLVFGGIEQLREDVNAVVASEKQWRVPFFWSFLIKFFIPPVLVIMIANGLSETRKTGERKFGNYEDYPTGYQFIGVFSFIIALLLVLVGMVFPNVYSVLAPLEQEQISKDQEVENEEPVSAIVQESEDREEI